MALASNIVKSNVPEEYVIRLRGLGANGAALTLEEGTLAGITSGYTSEGIYKLTFSENPGQLIGWHYAFGAATPADLKGYTAVRDTFDYTSSAIFTFSVYDSTFTLADLVANQYIDITLIFTRSGVAS